jgi:hypothetical protein
MANCVRKAITAILDNRETYFSLTYCENSCPPGRKSPWTEDNSLDCSSTQFPIRYIVASTSCCISSHVCHGASSEVSQPSFAMHYFNINFVHGASSLWSFSGSTVGLVPIIWARRCYYDTPGLLRHTRA